MNVQRAALRAPFEAVGRVYLSGVVAGKIEAKPPVVHDAMRKNTLETIAAVKNPPIRGVVHQANIANGPQQVNNGVVETTTPEQQSENPPNKLMEKIDGQRLDTRPPSKTTAEDSAMETVGAIYRADN